MHNMQYMLPSGAFRSVSSDALPTEHPWEHAPASGTVLGTDAAWRELEAAAPPGDGPKLLEGTIGTLRSGAGAVSLLVDPSGAGFSRDGPRTRVRQLDFSMLDVPSSQVMTHRRAPEEAETRPHFQALWARRPPGGGGHERASAGPDPRVDGNTLKHVGK